VSVVRTAEKLFRFEDLEVWMRAADIGFELGNLADELEQRHRYKFAEQLRSAGLSIANNIAEGSGCDFDNEFRRFLGYARRSAFECASMLLMFRRQGLISESFVQKFVFELYEISRMIVGLSRSLSR
jgi:four helix bundle protein